MKIIEELSYFRCQMRVLRQFVGTALEEGDTVEEEKDEANFDFDDKRKGGVRRSTRIRGRGRGEGTEENEKRKKRGRRRDKDIGGGGRRKRLWWRRKEGN